MPVTYFTEDEVQIYTRLLAECHEHIAHGSATSFSRENMLTKIATTLGWVKPEYRPELDPSTFNN